MPLQGYESQLAGSSPDGPNLQLLLVSAMPGAWGLTPARLASLFHMDSAGVGSWEKRESKNDALPQSVSKFVVVLQAFVLSGVGTPLYFQ